MLVKGCGPIMSEPYFALSASLDCYELACGLCSKPSSKRIRLSWHDAGVFNGAARSLPPSTYSYVQVQVSHMLCSEGSDGCPNAAMRLAGRSSERSRIVELHDVVATMAEVGASMLSVQMLGCSALKSHFMSCRWVLLALATLPSGRNSGPRWQSRFYRPSVTSDPTC